MFILFLKGLSGQQYDVSCIYSPWTDEHTLSAEHTLSDVLSCFIIFPAFNQDVQFTKAKESKLPGTACRTAPATFNTEPETRFMLKNVFRYEPVI